MTFDRAWCALWAAHQRATIGSVSLKWPKENQPVDGKLLDTIVLSKHAREQFVARARPGPVAEGREEGILRECMLLEGRATYKRPKWAPSYRDADWYVQIGDFLLCLIEKSRRGNRPWTGVQVENRQQHGAWSEALKRGRTQIPLPDSWKRLPPATRAAPATRKAPAQPSPPRPAPRAPARPRPAHPERQREPALRSNVAAAVVLIAVLAGIGVGIRSLVAGDDRADQARADRARRALAAGV